MLKTHHGNVLLMVLVFAWSLTSCLPLANERTSQQSIAQSVPPAGHTTATPRSTAPTAALPRTASGAGGDGGITLEEDAKIQPWPPSLVTVGIAAGNVVVVTWHGTGGGIRYNIYRKSDPDEAWQRVGSVQAVNKDANKVYTWTDTTAQPRTAYLYGVSVVSGYGLESGDVEAVPITTP